MESDDKTAKKPNKRSRYTKSERPDFSSSLSARLHPDFDPAENVAQALFTEKAAEEINPKTSPFEVLVELLHPTFIYEYFEKILQFLNSRDREICFPGIAPFKEAFLVRIAKENSYLRSTALDDKNRQLGAEILQVLEKNRNVFKWVYTFEDGIIKKNVLVYKKQFPGEAQNVQKKILSFKRPSASSLVSSMEDMSLSTERQDNIAPSFKTHFLNTTLKFIHDPNQLILVYPEMRLVEGQYIYSLIYNRNKSGALGFGFRTMYSTLHDAMTEIEKDYEFNVSFGETCDVNTTQIVLEKVRKTDYNGANNKKSNSSPVAMSSIDATKLPDIIRQLPESFMKPTLERATEFCEDDDIASLDFKKLPDAHAKLVTSIPKISRQEHLFDLFSPECRRMLIRIKIALKNDIWKLQICARKTCKKTFTRTITYSKEPVFDVVNKPLKSVVVRTDVIPLQTKPKDVVSRSNTPPEKMCATKNAKSEIERNLEMLYAKAANNNSKRKKYIQFQSAGAESVDTTSASAAPAPIASDVPCRLPAKKKKMLDALNTPMESDRAERMMRNMGWDGGALGVRGDGITEPIMPALLIKPGAGLGHVRPVQDLPATKHTAGIRIFTLAPGVKLPAFMSPAEFRILFLKDVLRFIEGNEDIATITYQQQIPKKKGWSFVTAAMRAINDRKALGLNSSEEKDLVSKICLKMIAQPSLLINFEQIKDSKQQIKLKKEIGSGHYSTRKKKKPRPSPHSSDVKDDIINDTNGLCDNKNGFGDVKIEFSDVNDKVTTEVISSMSVLELAGELEDHCASLKTAKKVAFRVLFLEKLRRFLADKNDVLEIKLDTPIRGKNKVYIEVVVAEINKRQYIQKVTGIELDIYKEILKSAGNCYLRIMVEWQRIMIKKKFYQKRFINTALDPPKSLDVKNTIIYKNNVAYKEELDIKKELDITEESVIKEELDTTEESDVKEELDIKEETGKKCYNKNSNEQNIDENDSDEDVLYIDDESNLDFDSDDTMSIVKTEPCDVDSKDLLSLDASGDSMTLDILDLDNTRPKLNEDDKSLTDLEVNNNQDAKNQNGDLKSKFQRFLDELVLKDSDISDKSSSISSLQKANESTFIKHVAIVPKCGGLIDIETVQIVQKLISDRIDGIDQNEFLPRLECQGIQNGGLTYSCHSEKTLNWLKDITVVKDVKIIDTDILDKSYKIKMKINSFIAQGVINIFRKLELYNPGLKTNSWELLKEEAKENSIEFTFNMNEDSFKFICGHNLSLLIGIDKAKFSIEWD